MNTEHDVHLIGRVVLRERRAFDELYRLYSRLVHSLALRILRYDHQEAENVTQDTFVQLWQQAHTYNVSKSSVKSWLVLLARSRALDRLRSLKSKQQGPYVSPIEEQSQKWQEQGDFDRSLAEAETRVHVRQLLQALPAEQREALEGAFFKGLTHQQMAEQWGLPLGTIKSRIMLGLRRLRQRLSDVQEILI